MSSRNAELLQIAHRYMFENYRPGPIVLVRGSGCHVFDADGRKYLDMAAGVAVSSVGHAHPVLVETVKQQAAQLLHASNYYYNEENVLLAKELCERTGYARAFFCNSGAEAAEALLKAARFHFYQQGDVNRQRIICFQSSFHGRTMGALSMTGNAKYREGFGEMGAVSHLPYGDLDAVKASMGKDVAAVMVEPVQGEGGVFVAPPGFIAGLRTLCDSAGSLLFVDEVQCGIGRLGRFLGHDGCGARADAIALAKGLGGGLPIGVMLTNEKLAGALPPGKHGATFGGNPVACAAARAVLRILDDEKLIAGAKEKGDALATMLSDIVRELPSVCELARGDGLLRAIVLRQGLLARDLVPKIEEKNVLITGAGERALRFSPPLIVTMDQLREGVAAVRAVLKDLEQSKPVHASP